MIRRHGLRKQQLASVAYLPDYSVKTPLEGNIIVTLSVP